MNAAPAVLTVREASVIRGRRRILDGVTLAFHPGTVTAVIGPNGSGKSTLLRVLAGSIRPDHGAVWLDGQRLDAIPPRILAGRRAVLSQERPLEFSFTVAELAALGAQSGPSRPRPAPLIARALDRVGLGAMAGRQIDRLSGGERQRAHLARALVQIWSGAQPGSAAILLLDEPLSAQDLVHQLDILDLARDHTASGGIVAIVLHDLNAAARSADRIVVLDHGRVAAEGNPGEVITASMLATVFQIGAMEPAARSAAHPTVLLQHLRRTGGGAGADPSAPSGDHRRI